MCGLKESTTYLSAYQVVVIQFQVMISLVLSQKAEGFLFIVKIVRTSITDDAKERLIPVEWESGLNDRKEYNVEIEITGFDRRGLLNEVLQAVNETKTNISAVSGRTDRNKMVTITMSISIVNVSHLQKVVERIKQIPDLYSVRRIMN